MRRSMMRASFPHRDFANPEAETCWLSCLFQSLWHSVVFHNAFDQHLAHAACEAGPEERILNALQATWAAYTAQDAASEGHRETAPEAAETSEGLVPASGLAEAFGQGYGDMSEALALIQDELSQSSSPAAVAIADQMVLVPLVAIDGCLPCPSQAWELAKEWQVTGSSLIAVDLTFQSPTREESLQLAELWCRDLGESDTAPRCTHQLVALVCYMWNLQHYVAFCRRQSDSSRCLFFNDLPCLTAGAPKDLPWNDVPKLCGAYCLTPRLALYESREAAVSAERAAKQASKEQTNSDGTKGGA